MYRPIFYIMALEVLMMPKKYFTIEEANKLLPSIEEELSELQILQIKFQHKSRKLKDIKELNQKYETAAEDIFQLESELEFMEIQAQLHANNIQALGAQLKGIDSGLIDFPAIIDDEEVLLCWKQGESKITHYHRSDEGFFGRKPINKYH
jgi:hypothetical protein